MVPVADSEFASLPPDVMTFSACKAPEPRIGDDVGAHGKCDAIADPEVCEDSAHGSRCSWDPIKAGHCEDVDCGMHGACDQTTGTCVCHGGTYWTGAGAGCETYSGNTQCWDASELTYERCCNPQDGVGDASCWGAANTYETCLCEAPFDTAEPVTYGCSGRSSAFDQLYRCFDGALAGMMLQPTADMVEQVCPGDFARCQAAAGCMGELWSHLSNFGPCTDRDLLASMQSRPSLACIARVCPAEMHACWMPSGTAECTATLNSAVAGSQEEPDDYPQEMMDVFLCFTFAQLQYTYSPCVDQNRCSEAIIEDMFCMAANSGDAQPPCSTETLVGDCAVCVQEMDCLSNGVPLDMCGSPSCTEPGMDDYSGPRGEDSYRCLEELGDLSICDDPHSDGDTETYRDVCPCTCSNGGG